MDGRSRWIVWAASMAALAASPKDVPRVQAIPLPRGEVAFECDGHELCRLHTGDGLRRPFLYPVNGPSGLSLTRMGHPHDPVSHSHHNSVWLSHALVNGRDFWSDSGDRITDSVVTRMDDGDASAVADLRCRWLASDGSEMLREFRSITVRPDSGEVQGSQPEWLLVIDSRLEATAATVNLGDTPFGLIGVRMRRSIGVTDGGGTIRNSEGGVDEEGCFRKPARWVDYSGPVSNGIVEGITLFDHPANPGHPVAFHVRDDGWMGASLTLGNPLSIPREKSLRIRYGLWIHAGLPAPDVIEKRWESFTAIPTDPD